MGAANTDLREVVVRREIAKFIKDNTGIVWDEAKVKNVNARSVEVSAVSTGLNVNDRSTDSISSMEYAEQTKVKKHQSDALIEDKLDQARKELYEAQ
ncbi:hypothetical protein BGW41_006739, partial [Actinomortierella wolfii]